MTTPCPWDALLEARDALTATAQSGRMAVPTRLLLCEDLLRLYRAMTAVMEEHGVLQEKYGLALRSETDALRAARQAQDASLRLAGGFAALSWMAVVHGGAGLDD
jgi:hypothetical protein